MSTSLRSVFLFVLAVLLVTACGKSDDKKDSPGATNIPQNESDGSDVNRTIRYSTVVMEENCGFWTDCDFTIRSDFNRRPVILTANFVDNGFPSRQPVIDEGKCDFQVTLTEEQADQLEGLADKLRICEVKNAPTADRGFDGLFMTDISGEELMVYKFKDGGQEEGGKVKYLCAGRVGFYNYMKKLITPAAPEECPAGYQRLFK